MSELLRKFQGILGKNTRQAGHFWCIPASISNATRLLGTEEFSQEKIRDAWYALNNKQIESNVNEQLKDVGFGIVQALENHSTFSSVFATEVFTEQGDQNPFDVAKAEQALDFIKKHAVQEHPVVVSTWMLDWQSGALSPACCHMWLLLGYDEQSNVAFVHDPATDQVVAVGIRLSAVLNFNGQVRQLDIGLRGRITHTDYSCLAIWRKTAA